MSAVTYVISPSTSYDRPSATASSRRVIPATESAISENTSFSRACANAGSTSRRCRSHTLPLVVKMLVPSSGSSIRCISLCLGYSCVSPRIFRTQSASFTMKMSMPGCEILPIFIE
ncbi:hypothetical protein D3C81_1292760 [compost metagenome]